MHEILRHLPAGSRVLDLGCNEGSFAEASTSATVVRIDRETPTRPGDHRRFVQCDAGKLPFADHSFAAVVSNHSLEHFEDLAGTLAEISRIVKADGAVFVSVPDASTITDKLYRWLARGGGHVNAFTSAEKTAAAIAAGTGLRHVGTRVLYSSLSFLNRRNVTGWPPKRLLLLGAGAEWTLFLYEWVSRKLDRWFGTRTGIYGWAFYFGRVGEPVDVASWINVCIRCGSGHPSSKLQPRRNALGVRCYRCPFCGARNPFAEDGAAL